MTTTLPADVDLEARLPLFETLVEQSAPPPANPCVCLCLRCSESRNRRVA